MAKLIVAFHNFTNAPNIGFEIFSDSTDLNNPFSMYEACLESKDTKILNMYNIFNLQKRHCEWIACT
jgi:hypothetical protein